MRYKGRAHKFGNDINTDDIIPAKYLNIKEPRELAKHCLEHADKNFAKKVKKGDMIVGGKNFGCGSSREHAPLAIKGLGISCVIAESFARIFARNAINIGLPIFDSKEAVESIKQNDALEVDSAKGIIRNISKKKEYKTEAYPPFLAKIIKKGGLINYVKR